MAKRKYKYKGKCIATYVPVGLYELAKRVAEQDGRSLSNLLKHLLVKASEWDGDPMEQVFHEDGREND